MTVTELKAEVRRQLEELPPDAQGRAIQRAFQRDVLVWTYLTPKQLWRLYGAIRATALIWAGA